MIDWSDYPNFSKKEFDCKHTGENRMRPEVIEFFQQMRIIYGKPMKVNSGYRAASHPAEASKTKPGEHFYGMAGDFACSDSDAMELFVIAYSMGARRIGIYQNKRTQFIHIGLGDQFADFPTGQLWTP